MRVKFVEDVENSQQLLTIVDEMSHLFQILPEVSRVSKTVLFNCPLQKKKILTNSYLIRMHLYKMLSWSPHSLFTL